MEARLRSLMLHSLDDVWGEWRGEGGQKEKSSARVIAAFVNSLPLLLPGMIRPFRSSCLSLVTQLPCGSEGYGNDIPRRLA